MYLSLYMVTEVSFAGSNYPKEGAASAALSLQVEPTMTMLTPRACI